MSNDKKRRKLILAIAIVLVLINVIVFSILFTDLSKYIWPEKITPVEEDNGYKLSKDGTVTIDGITYKQKDDGNFIVLSAESALTSADIRMKINEDDETNVNEIGEKAFENCTEITQINIASTITKIGSYAFSGCSKLTTITIPYGVTEIGDSCFVGCKSLTSIKVNVANTNFTHYNGVLYDYEGKKLYAYPYSKTDEQYKLADNLESIEKNAFRGFENLKSVALPENLKNIGESAFEDCKNLENVLILKNVTTIGENAFKNCSENLVIYGEKDSYAETYAKENNITFKLSSERPNPTTNEENNTDTQNKPVTDITAPNNTTSENTINNNAVSNNTMTNVANTLEEQSKEQFNIKFNSYEGNRSGSQVKQLLKAVLDSNSDNNDSKDMQITVFLNNTELKDLSNTSSIGASKKYNVKCEKGNSGYINKISITEQ